MKSDGDASTRELAAHLGQQLTKLVNAEVALAKAELFASARQMMLGGGLFGGAGFVAVTAWLVMVAAAVAGISIALPVWAAALIVGGALALVAGVLAMMGRRKIRRGTPPLQMTTSSVRHELGELASATTSARDAVLDSVKSNGTGQRVPVQRGSRTPVERVRHALTPGGGR